MRFIQTNEPGEDDFSKRLSEFVARVKENEKFRKEFANMNLHDFDIMTEAKEEGLAEGREEGARQKAVENARSFYANGVSVDIIAKSLNMTIEQVKEIVCETTQTAN